MAGESAWRTNDVVAYDVMRESATALTALLVEASSDDSSASVKTGAEIWQLRRSVLDTNSYDREAVSALTDRIGGRIKELTETRS